MRALIRRSYGRAATLRRVVTFVAGPKRRSSQDATKSDHDPRGSLGSQNPYVVKIEWNAMTMAAPELHRTQMTI